MKWKLTLFCVAVLAILAAIFYMHRDEEARKARTGENIKALDRDWAALISDTEMQTAVVDGALSDYANSGTRLYFRFGAQKAKLSAKDKRLVDALHKCAQPSDVPIPGKEKSWMADSQCVENQLH
ncbi:MAG: hypothetical protein WCA10_25430 [Terracidiphilus sp.]